MLVNTTNLPIRNIYIFIQKRFYRRSDEKHVAPSFSSVDKFGWKTWPINPERGSYSHSSDSQSLHLISTGFRSPRDISSHVYCFLLSRARPRNRPPKHRSLRFFFSEEEETYGPRLSRPPRDPAILNVDFFSVPGRISSPPPPPLFDASSSFLSLERTGGRCSVPRASCNFARFRVICVSCGDSDKSDDVDALPGTRVEAERSNVAVKCPLPIPFVPS